MPDENVAPPVQQTQPVATPNLVSPIPKKSNTKMWLLVGVLVVILVGGAYYLGTKTNSATPPSQTSNQTTPTKLVTQKELNKITTDGTTSTYTNNQLGYSVQFPSKVAFRYGGCTKVVDSYRPVDAPVPTKVFEEADTSIISNEYYYKLTGESEEGGYYKYSGCVKETNNLSLIKDEKNSSHIMQILINVKNVTNNSEIDSFIKEKFGTDCSFGSKKASTAGAWDDITVFGGSSFDDDTSNCRFPHERIYLRFYPEINAVVSIHLGSNQSCTLGVAVNDDKNPYPKNSSGCQDDEKVASSFKFLN